MTTKKLKTTSTPKQVVYLWGAGATQGEIDYLGAYPVNLLMRDSPELGEGIATRILNRLNKKWRSTLTVDGGPDIEKLISLLVGSGAPELAELAEKIRRYCQVNGTNPRFSKKRQESTISQQAHVTSLQLEKARALRSRW